MKDEERNEEETKKKKKENPKNYSSSFRIQEQN